MSIPICPEHQTPMRESKFGGFYCGRKNGEDYCKQKSGKGNPLSQMKTASELLSANEWGANSKDARVAAALEFAGRIYQGTAGESEQAALLLAERALLMFEHKP